ncbi:MAG: dUTP diphosphatase [Clostridia bacterium]
MEIKFKKLTKTAKTPTRDTRKSAGFDIYADIAAPIVISPNTTVKIRTGIAMTPPEGHFAAIFARSSMSTKRGLAPSCKVGIRSEDFTGEYVIGLHNHSDESQILEVGEKIAQIVFIPYAVGDLVEE